MKWSSSCHSNFSFTNKDASTVQTKKKSSSTKFPILSIVPPSPHPFDKYSITRVNPIFVEDDASKSVTVPLRDNSYCKRHELLTSAPEESVVNIVNKNSDFVNSVSVTGVQACCSERIKPHEFSGSAPISILENEKYNAPRLHKSRNGYQMDKSVSNILRELSCRISATVDRIEKSDVAHDYLLESLRGKISDTLEALSNLQTKNPSKENVVATLSRAFSFVNSFENGSHLDEDIEHGRLLLLKRLGRVSSYNQMNHSSSSSDASTSGFSDLTHTPASSSSSSSESPTASRNVGHEEAQKIVFINDNSNDIDILSDKTHSDKMENNQSTIRNHPPSVNLDLIKYDQLLLDAARAHIKSISQDCCISLVDPCTQLNIANLQGGIYLKTRLEKQFSCYPGHRCPDFTLDPQRGERLMRKMEAKKKERCWCRLLASVFGFLFLLFSIMAFSMMLTRGEKMFGSL